MNSIKTFYKRNLPHYQPIGYTFFITFRLKDSLPLKVILKLKDEKEKELKAIVGIENIKLRKEKCKELQSRYFGKFDKLLDLSNYGPKWLKHNNIAQVVYNAILIRDKKKYELISTTIMPNHVHIIFTPLVGLTITSTNTSEIGVHLAMNSLDETGNSTYIVTKILQDLKSKTALDCNNLLNRSGAFWQHESYDHVVRDKEELKRIVKYVLHNPVKAGLCEKWEDWKYSYCNFELIQM
jgi:REP element-mobilizing transposase RayT